MIANMLRRLAVLFAAVPGLCSSDGDYDLGIREAEPRVAVQTGRPIRPNTTFRTTSTPSRAMMW